MKYCIIIASLLITLSFRGFGQVDSSVLVWDTSSVSLQDSDFVVIMPVDSMPAFIYFDDTNSSREISITDDTNFISMVISPKHDTDIEIAGDTMFLIKLLFNELLDSMTEKRKLDSLLDEAEQLLYKKYFGVEAILPEKKRI